VHFGAFDDQPLVDQRRPCTAAAHVSRDVDLTREFDRIVDWTPCAASGPSCATAASTPTAT
jgi:hypothetical protein